MTQFEVEWAGVVADTRPVVLARVLGPPEFRVADGATLAGCRLRPILDMPRAVDTGGRQRSDLFAFELRSADDVHRFAPGQIVALVEAGRPPDPAP